VIQNSGKTPNFAILPRDGYVAVKNHVSVLDRLKYTNAMVTMELLKGLLGMGEVLVPTAVKDTAAEGLTPSISPFFADFAFVGWKPQGGGGIKTPSCGYWFIRSQPRVRSWFDDERNATAIEVEIKAVPKVVSSLSGYFIKDTMA
jgi:hypothetical protein